MSSKTRTRKTRTTATTGTAPTMRSVPAQPTTATIRTDTEDKLWAALHANPHSTVANLAAAAKIGKSTAQKILVKWAGDGSVTRTTGIAASGRRAADLWAIAEADPSVAPDTTDKQAMDAAPADTALNVPTAALANPDQADFADATPAEENLAEPVDAEPTAATASDDAPHNTDNATPEKGEPADATPTSTQATNPVQDTSPDDATRSASDDEKDGKAERLASGALRGMVEDYLRDHPGDQFGPTAIAKALGGTSSGAVSNICGSFGDVNESSGRPAMLEQEIADVLAALESEGLAARVSSGDQAQRRAVEPSRKRLPQGGLQGLVEDFLAEHADQEFGPHAIGTALSRSSGAVANALARLTERGVAVQVSQHPRRYRAAATS